MENVMSYGIQSRILYIFNIFNLSLNVTWVILLAIEYVKELKKTILNVRSDYEYRL